MKLGKVIIKLHTKSLKIKVASKNFHALCVVRLILGFMYILPMLECVHALIKIVQSQNVFYVSLWNIKLTNKNYISFIMILLPSMKT